MRLSKLTKIISSKLTGLSGETVTVSHYGTIQAMPSLPGGEVVIQSTVTHTTLTINGKTIDLDVIGLRTLKILLDATP